MKSSKRARRVVVSVDGQGVVSHAGVGLLREMAEYTDLIACVVAPTSLLDGDRVLAEMGKVSASLSTRKRTLRCAHAGTYRARSLRRASSGALRRDHALL